jgi:putative Ca2+/H+ antiporter (TMEM165/GDT1 family)
MEAFINTTAVVALDEMGDKRPTAIIAAKYGDFTSVMSGAKIGEMLAITPAILLENNRAMDTVSVGACSSSMRVCCNGYMDKYL